MPYKIEIIRPAERKIEKFNKQLRAEIVELIYKLAENPRPFGYKKLKNREAYRVRLGDYRIIYEIQDKVLIITVVDVGHRRDIYD
jgi:mRNA interferase RelE/StbE